MRESGKDGKHGKYEESDAYTSHTSHPVLPPRGDYQTLLTFQKAEVIYDLTFRLVHKSLPKGDRTVDQMLQAARSGN